jgi:hypothetical protein
MDTAELSRELLRVENVAEDYLRHLLHHLGQIGAAPAGV